VGVGIGVTVFVTALSTNGLNVSVAIAGAIEAGIPPSGVGVAYCPHNEAFPPQAARKKEAAIKKLISRFTRKLIPLVKIIPVSLVSTWRRA
jgi:hypothetical protein